jgi:hypothetical protein
VEYKVETMWKIIATIIRTIILGISLIIFTPWWIGRFIEYLVKNINNTYDKTLLVKIRTVIHKWLKITQNLYKKEE